VNKICCFTGHRPQRLPWGYNESDFRCQQLKIRIRNEVQKAIAEGYTNFISGMALGTDTYFAEIVLKERERNNAIKLECAVPCKNQAEKWFEKDKRRYADLLSRADKVSILSETYTPTCMNDRNKYMVDKSERVIAVWNGLPSGAANTIRYAKMQNKQIIVIKPCSPLTKKKKSL
jgi:uncharacterized phage-like protein YoqJ